LRSTCDHYVRDASRFWAAVSVGHCLDTPAPDQ
jgi:hypothetical protein